jgi:hypothetical protein
MPMEMDRRQKVGTASHEWTELTPSANEAHAFDDLALHAGKKMFH